MHTDILISIIVPVYNVASFIVECFNSIVSQTFDKSIECIFIDDFGTDDSMSIVNELISNYDGTIRFRVIEHEQNKGLSATRNTGIRAAKGEYIYFLDSDDFLLPNCFEYLVECIRLYPDASAVFSGCNMTEPKYIFTNFESADIPYYSNNKEWIKKMMLSYKLHISPWNKLVRRDFIIENNLFFAEGYIYEDQIWNYEMSKVLSTIAICHHNTYVYRIRPNSIMTSAVFQEKRVDNTMYMLSRLISNIDSFCKMAQIQNIWMNLVNLRRCSFSKSQEQKWKQMLLQLAYMSPCYFRPVIRFSCYLTPFILRLNIINWVLSKLWHITIRDVSPIIE